MRSLATMLAVSYMRKTCLCPVFALNRPKTAIQSSVRDYGQDSPKESAPSLSKRFKTMWKNYWYVLLPVHVSTSAVWLGGFYFMCKSGVDVGSFIEAAGFSEHYVEKLKSSDMGYYALSYACYKIATPARYTVTLAGTTASINYLMKKGYLKTTSEISNRVKERGEELKEKYEETRDEMKEKYDVKRAEIKEKVEERVDDFKHKFKKK